MLTPISTLLDAVARQLPRDLVTARARRALRHRAAGIPSAWFAGCVECRLDGTSDQTDLLVYAPKGDGQKRMAAALAGGRGAEFGRARPLLEEWTRRRSLLGRELSAIWLEYDLPADQVTPDPFAFVALYPDYLNGGYPQHVFHRPIPSARTRKVAAAGLRAALGHVPSDDALGLLEHCAASLPRHGRMFHVVGMPDRPSTDLRIGAILPARSLRSWLRVVGWPGRQRQLDAIERVVGGGVEMLHVQLELGESVRPLLSIDFESRLMPRPSDRWHAFVERLTESGPCERDLALAALSWLKSRIVRLPGETLPLRMDQQLFFKVTSRADRIEAKAYLLFQPRHALL